MTQAQESERKRRNMEIRYGLYQDPSFKKRINRETHNTLLLLATLLAAVYILVIGYITKHDGAKPGEILAKSEMTRAEIKALDISK